MNNLYEIPKSGLDGFDHELRSFITLPFATLPAYQAVLRSIKHALEESAAVRAVLARAWQHRQFWSLYERPVLLTAALRFTVFSAGEKHPLWGPLELGEAQNTPHDAVLQALLHPPNCLLHALTQRSVQTNEITRAIAWRLMTQEANHRPLGLIDVGCSAGLNLIADQLPLRWTDQDGRALQIPAMPPVVARVGFDRSPIDITDLQEVRWLTACIRPGETARLQRLEAAVQALKTLGARHAAPRLVRCDATEAPKFIEAMMRQRPEVFWLVYQTGFRDYLPPDKRDQYEAAMRAVMEMQPIGSMLWMELETATQGGCADYPAWIAARSKGEGGGIQTEIVARCNYHPERLRLCTAATQLAS